MKKLWHRLFLDERPSISLSVFRMAVAFTCASHVIPSFVHLDETYFETAFRTVNTTFFPVEFIEWVLQSPKWLNITFVWIFCVSAFFLFIGFLSQLSCIAMLMSCYYFYALNAFHVGTLSWDILLVTVFLMCLTPYHGDYFSVDCLLWGREDAYKRRRPYYLQRLLQLQIGFTFFYTSIYKVTGNGNWLTGNPIYNIMHAPIAGNTKLFLLRDFLMVHPQLCYWIGVSVVALEFLMIFLLFWPKTRISAIYLGCVFHVVLILTLDVPATFFFLFPPQLWLFVNPERIVAWIDQKRAFNRSAKKRNIIVFDGNCRFCRKWVRRLKIMDLFATLDFADYHTINVNDLHPRLDREKASGQLQLIESGTRLYSGFAAFRRLSLSLPMLYPAILIFYFPGMEVAGPILYRLIAKNRYLFHASKTCRNNSCFR